MLFQGVNSNHGCRNISNANILGGMKKRKPLEPWQKEDAERLNRLWLKHSKEHGISQFDLALDLGWKTQGSVSQYLLGTIPLNWPAVIKFARAFGVPTKAISEKLTAENAIYNSDSGQTINGAGEKPAVNITMISPAGKTMVVPPDLVGAVEDLIKAWATSTVTKRQLHAYRQMFRADAQLEELPPLAKEKPSGITKNISKFMPPDPESQH